MRLIQVRCGGRIGALILLACLLAAPGSAAEPAPRMEDLRRLRPDGRAVPVFQMDLQRDAFTFHFESGAFYFLTPVAGRTVGAVFLGEGSYRLEPQTPWEQQLLAAAAGRPENAAGLTDTFSEMVLFFTDDTDREIGLHAPLREGEAPARAADALARWQRRETDELRVDLRLRLLRELLNRRLRIPGSFFALMDGARLAPTLAGVDALGADALGLIDRAGGEGSFLYVADPRREGLWYLSAERDELASGRRLAPAAEAELLARRVSARLDPPVLATSAALRLRIRTPDVRALPIAVPPGEVSLAATREEEGAPARFLEVVPAAAGARGGALVIFPEPLSTGTEILLRLDCRNPSGLQEAGSGRLHPTAPGAWFASFAAETPVPTELTFDLPGALQQLAATGRPFEATAGVEGRWSSRWESALPVWSPGFIAGELGAASAASRLAPGLSAGRLELALYRRPHGGVPEGLAGGQEPPPIVFPQPHIPWAGGSSNEGGPDPPPSPPSLGRLSRPSSWRTEPAAELLAQVASRFARVSAASLLGLPERGAAPAQSGGATGGASDDIPAPLLPYFTDLDRLSAWFGPFPSERATFLTWPRGTPAPGWNGLIAAPALKLRADGQRRLGETTWTASSAGLRSLARHWWGLSVRPSSYRDRWIEEGLQEMAVTLLLDEEAASRHWNRVRKELLAPAPGKPVPRHRLGPLFAGERLALVHPDASSGLLAGKGGYVFHMLRSLLRQPGPDPDQRFALWLRELAAQYGGKTLSTDALAVSLEKYLPAAARPARSGGFSWFFDQWVRGTDIPSYSSSLQLHPAGEGTWRVSGRVRQKGVPPLFVGIVPVYLELEGGELFLFARLRIEGTASAEIDETVTVPKPPRRVLINALGDVLSLE